MSDDNVCGPPGIELRPAGEKEGGAQALVSHLRAHPHDRTRSPADLGAEFGLSEQFVQRVLRGATQSHRSLEQDVADATRKVVLDLAQRLDEAWETAARHPGAFVATSVFGSELIFTLLLWWRHSLTLAGFRYSIVSSDAWIVGVPIAAAHMAVYFRRAMVRYPIYGGLICWALVSVPAVVLTLPKSADSPIAIAREALYVLPVLFLVAALYALFGALACLAGGYVKLVRQEQREGQMGRREMLERLFELQKKLESAKGAKSEFESWEDRPLVQQLRRHLYGISALLGAVLELGDGLLQTWRNMVPTSTVRGTFVVEVTAGTYQLLFLASGAALAFLAPSVGASLAVGLLFIAGRLLVHVVPTWVTGHPFWADPVAAKTAMLDAAQIAGVALVGGIARAVQAKALKDAGLRRNDEASVVAEMLRLQWRLAGDVCATCVMVVDAAKSTQMKVEEDALAVEYSFREYQEWIEEICASFGGRILSTAGDGAVASFRDCSAALAAARKLQGNVEHFNRAVNRLESPFRLRIGLHSGEVAGDVGKIQFTEVIDIAAHAQAMSPVSGIALTDAVVEHLDASQFVPLATQVDGHSIYLALDPIGAG